MTEEEKQLLLQDLAARLPYEIILLSSNEKITYQTDGNTAAELLVEEGWISYLRPMSSMTEEENKKLNEIWLKHTIKEGADYLNSIHVDYRGLIEKGLALEAPEGMYKK